MEIKTLHPQINGILELMDKEISYFRKIHRLIDLCEVLIKTHTSYILADYFCVKDIDDDIKGLLASLLIIPSLGSWQTIGRAVINDLALPKAIEKDEFEKLEDKLVKKQRFELLDSMKNVYNLSGEVYKLKDDFDYEIKNKLRKDCFSLNGYESSSPMFVKDFYRVFNWWDDKVGKNKLVEFRNRYAHGATPSEEYCKEEFDRYWNVVKNIFQSSNMAWLFNTSIVVFKQENEKLVPAWLDEQSYGFLTEERIANIFANNSSVRQNRPYLVNEQGKLLDLFPFLYYKKHEKLGRDTIIFYNDLKNKDKKEVSYLNYSYGDHIKEKEIYKEFMDIIKIEEWKKQLRISFDERIEELTNIFEGREEELKGISEFLKNREKGFCFITGAPGIGKSSLAAKVIKTLKQETEVDVIEYMIKRGNGNSGDILKYLNYKLEEVFKTGVSIDEKNLKASLETRLKDVSKKLGDKKLVIIIDGLDEGIKEDREILSNLIYESYSGIYVIYSSRMSKEVKKFYHNLDREEKFLMELKGLSLEEIRALLYEVINKYELEDDYVEEVKKKSEGNPLYVKLLCRALDEGEMKINDSISLTSSINDFYEGIVDRYLEMENGQWILKALCVIACAKQFVSEKFIKLAVGYCYGEGENEIPMALNELMEVLISNLSKKDEYQLFHESFREYLLTARQDDIIEGEKAIASFCDNYSNLSEYSDTVSMYPYKFYSYHLKRLKRLDDMERLCEEGFIEKQINTTGSYTFSLNFLRDAVELAIEKKDMNKVLKFVSIMGKLYIELNNSSLKLIEKRFDSVEEVGKALMEVALTDEVKQDILYLNLLVKALDDKNEDIKREKIKLILDDMQKREKTGNWCNIIPMPYMIKVMRDLKELSIDVLPILKGGEIKYDDAQGNEYISRIFEDFDLTKKADCRFLYDLREIMGDNKIKYMCSLAKAIYKSGTKEWARPVLKQAMKQAEEVEEPNVFTQKGVLRSSLYGICAEAAICLNEQELYNYCLDKVVFLQDLVKSHLYFAKANATMGKMEESKNNLQEALKYAYEIKEHDNSIVPSIISICNAAKELGFEDLYQSCEREAVMLAEEDNSGMDYEMLAEYLINSGRVDEGLNIVKTKIKDYRAISKGMYRLLLELNEMELAEKVLMVHREFSSQYVFYETEKMRYYFRNNHIDKVMQIIEGLTAEYTSEDGEVYDSDNAYGYQVLCEEYIKDNQINKAEEIYLKEKLNSPYSMAKYLAAKGYDQQALKMIRVLGLEKSTDLEFYKTLSYSAFKSGNEKNALVYINLSLKPLELLGDEGRERNKVIYISLHRIRQYIISGSHLKAFKQSKNLSEYCRNTYSYLWDNHQYDFDYILSLTRNLEEETDSEQLLKVVETAIDTYKTNNMFHVFRSGTLQGFNPEEHIDFIEELEKEEHAEDNIIALEELVYCTSAFHEKGDFDNRDKIIDLLLKLYDKGRMHSVDRIFGGLFYEVKVQGNNKYEKRIEEIIIKEEQGKVKDGSNLTNESYYLMRLNEQTTLLRLLKECGFKGKEFRSKFQIISKFLNDDNLKEIKNYIQENDFLLGREGKKAILGAILENLYLVDNYEEELYEIIPELITDEQGVEKILRNFLLHQYYYFTDDRKNLAEMIKAVKDVIWIEDLKVKEDNTKYNYDNLTQWIKSIEDKQKQIQILMLSNNVMLELISKEEFNEKVKELLVD